jgi:hypothetical protein
MLKLAALEYSAPQILSSRSDDATSQLAAKFAVSAAIAHPLLAQLFFVEAGLPQLSTPCSSAVAITSIAIIVMAIPGPDIDTPGPDLKVHLREC